MTDALLTRLTCVLLAVAVLVQALFAAWPGIDLAVSAALTDADGHFGAKAGILPAVNATVRTLMEALTALTLLTTAVLWWQGRLTGGWGRIAGFFGLALVLVPGIIVNLILKSHVGRARPETVTEFGGTLPFTPAWQVGSACLKNCSFTSGEVALAATWAICLTVWLWPHLSLRGKARAAVLAVGFVTLVSGLRLVLGRHFLSDAVFSTLIAAFVALALFRALNLGVARRACPPEVVLSALRQGVRHLPGHAAQAWHRIQVLSGVTVVPDPGRRKDAP